MKGGKKAHNANDLPRHPNFWEKGEQDDHKKGGGKKVNEEGKTSYQSYVHRPSSQENNQFGDGRKEKGEQTIRPARSPGDVKRE